MGQDASDRNANRLEEWKHARDTIKDFDDRIHDLRKYGFSVITTLLTITGFLSTAGVDPITEPARVAVIAAIMLLIVALRYMERNYQMFQRAISDRARILENLLNLELTGKIVAWYKRGKLWYADLVYLFFALAAFFVGLATVPSSLFQTMLLVPLLLVLLSLVAMQRYLDVDRGFIDVTVDELEYNPGETATVTLTNLYENQPFKPGSVMLQIRSEDGTFTKSLPWPSDGWEKLSSWSDYPSDHSLYLLLRTLGPRLRGAGYVSAHARIFVEDPLRMLANVPGFVRQNRERRIAAREVRVRRQQALQVSKDWGQSVASMKGLIWPDKMQSYVWPWDTSGSPPGMYSVVTVDRVSEKPVWPAVYLIRLAAERETFTAPLRFAAISQAAPGDATVVHAVAGKKIRVIGYSIGLTEEGTLKFHSTGGPDLTGPMKWGPGATAYYAPQAAAFETEMGKGLDVTTTQGAARGHLTYIEV